MTLQIAAATADPVVFVYLEDVAPDGRVSYLTEGQLRLIHRKPASAAKLPYDQGPAPHSFNRADAMPVTPGEVMNVSFALFPTAALIRAGHKFARGHCGRGWRHFPPLLGRQAGSFHDSLRAARS